MSEHEYINKCRNCYVRMGVVIVAMTASTFLGFYGRLDAQAVVAIISAGMGYTFGDFVARRG